MAVSRFLLYLSPFFFPLYLVRFRLHGVPFTALEVFTYVLFGVFLLGLILRKGAFVWSRRLGWYWGAALLLLAGATWGVFAAPLQICLPGQVFIDSKAAALGVWKGWVLAPMLYFLALTGTLKNRMEVDKLLRLFVYSAALVSVIAYVLAVVGDGVTYDARLSGFFESANYLSLYLVPAFILSLRFFMVRPATSPGWQDYLNLASLVAMAHALFFTQSYAALIGVFAAFGLYVFFLIIHHRMGFRNVLIGGGVLLVTFTVLIATQIHTPKFQQFIDFKNRSSSSVRLEIYDIAVNLVKEHPLTGIGPGLFQPYYQTDGPRFLGHAPMEWNIPHPHNVFLAFWLNAGLLGLIALLAFLVLAHTRWTYPLIALWGIMVHGLFDTPFWKNDLAMIFWLILGAIVILQNDTPDPPQKPAVQKRESAPSAPNASAPKKRPAKKPRVRKAA